MSNEDFHEGDMADEIVEYVMGLMSYDELLEWARLGYSDHVKSWPNDLIRKRYANMTGGDTDEM